MSQQRDSIIHLVAGGVAGTVAAIATCPLEVVKTRLQSSSGGFYPPTYGKESCCGSDKKNSFQQKRGLFTGDSRRYSLVTLSYCSTSPPPDGRPHNIKQPGIWKCLKYICKHEGPKGLFKGLVPNIIGVAPSRAVYFSTYSQSKAFLNTCLTPESPLVHMGSAACAGFTSCTLTNPIWFIKTRLQLNHHADQSAYECAKRIYQQSGIRGFYKGISASYVGITETIVHFVIYEGMKTWLIERRVRMPAPNSSKTMQDYAEFMIAGAVSKLVASCVAYPHEVIRTRLREEGNKYQGFAQTTVKIYAEEGFRGLYRGLVTQLIRQVPNTAIMMATYEGVVYILTNLCDPTPDVSLYNSDLDTEFYTESKSKLDRS